jgi:hypothetical protein
MLINILVLTQKRRYKLISIGMPMLLKPTKRKKEKPKKQRKKHVKRRLLKGKSHNGI